MDDTQLIFGCVAVLLFSSTVHCEGTCSYLYTHQPDKANKSCTLESPIPLELRCQVSGIDNFTIQWHYSNSSSPPAQNNSTSMESLLDTDSKSAYNMSKNEVIQNMTSGVVIVSVLRLTDYDETVSGYYWCTVNTTESTNSTFNPSQILSISICPFTGNTIGGVDKCTEKVDLFKTSSRRCADSSKSINIVTVHFPELCSIDGNEKPPTTTKIEETTQANKPLATSGYTELEITTTDGAFNNHDQSNSSPSFPMHFVWVIVAIAFTLLIAVIIVMLIAIIYLNHKKNKIRVSSSSRNHIHNPYVEYSNPDSLKRDILMSTASASTGQQEIRAEAEAEYEIPTNVIHAHNATFGGDQSPDSKTSSSKSAALHSPAGEYEEVSTVKATRDSIKSTQRHQYEMVVNESDEQSEYSHLQHAHGGSQRRKFSTNSTGTGPLPNSRGKLSITSLLSLSASGHQSEPVFDSPEYMTIQLEDSRSTKTQHETDLNVDTGYSHINHEALKGKDTTEAEGPEQDGSEGYHQLPSVFTGVANNHIRRQSSNQERQNSHTTNTHPPAHRHNSAATASDPYTPIESASVMKHNAYSFTIVSTDEQYVSERGHVYHLLERSDEHQQNTRSSYPGSAEGSPKFRIQGEDSVKDRRDSSSIPPYSQVNKSPKQAPSERKEMEQSDHSQDQSDCSSLQDSSTESSHKIIPPYSQVDKSKKKNRRLQAQLDAQDSQETHHYHVLEQNSKDKTEEPCDEKGGPIYHIIDHEP